MSTFLSFIHLSQPAPSWYQLAPMWGTLIHFVASYKKINYGRNIRLFKNKIPLNNTQDIKVLYYKVSKNKYFQTKI